MNENINEEDELIRDKAKTFEVSKYLKNDSQDENFLNETLVDTIMDGEDSISNIDIKDNNIKHKYFYEFFISFFLFINSFISYSFTNIFHLCYSYYIIYNLYLTCYSITIKLKKYFGIIIIIIDSIYLFLKASIHFYMNAQKEKPKNKDRLKEKIFVIFNNNWRTIYDYIATSLIIIMLVINIIIKNFNHEYFNNNILIQNIRTIEKHLKKSIGILNLGVLLICLGSTFFPSLINLIILFFGIIFFYSQLVNKNIKFFMRKYLKYFFLLINILYTIYNYFFSSFIIQKKILTIDKNEKISFYFGIVKLFEKKSENNEAEYNNNILGIFHFLFFYVSFYFINLHVKFVDYLNNTQNNQISLSTSYLNEKDINSLIEFKYDNEEQVLDEAELYNTKTISLTGSFIINKEKTKFQILFDSDMDCAIIFFLEETKNNNIFKKIKLFLSKFCYTPNFSLHICRIGFIYWINFFNIYYESYFIIIWLLFSIKHSKNKYFLLFTKYIIYPFIIAIFFLSYIINIIDKENRFDIEPEKSDFNKFIHMSTKLIVIFLFQKYIQLNEKHLKNLKDKEIRTEIKKQQKDLEKKIEQYFKGKYVVKPLEIFFKLYFILIDILLVVFFYLSLSQKINLFNQVILIGIISFLVVSHIFKKYLYIYLWILTVSFLLKYTIYFYKINEKTDFKLFLDLLFNDDLEEISYYWIAYYLLFLEYIGQKCKLYKLCKSKSFSMYEIIDFNLGSFTYIKFILNTLFNFIFGIYIWLLIPCFLYSLLIYDNNFISLVQLTIVFIVYYKYILIVNTKYKSDNNIYKYTRILIIINIFNLIIEYILQFLNNPYYLIHLYFYYPKRTMLDIIELIGFFLFKSNYTKNLINYFMMFILSLALHIEIQRQFEINTKDSTIKTELEKYSFVNAINKFSSIRNELENDTTKINDKEYNKQRLEKIEKKLKENQKTKKIVKKLYNILYYFLHYYWIVIFLFIAILSIHWMLSISMIIQLSIFSYYMGKSFYGYYKCLKSQNYINKNGIKIYNKLNLNQKIKLYKEEKKLHFQITSQTQHSYYNLIWIFTFSFIILSYLNSIILKIINISEGKDSAKKYISAITYILGVYSEPKQDSSNYNFWSYTWGYFIIIGLFSLRAYLMSKFAEIKVMYFNEDQQKNRTRNFSHSSKASRQSKFLEIELIEQINKLGDVDLSASIDLSYDNIKMDFFDDENNSDIFNIDKTYKSNIKNVNVNKLNEYQDFLNSDSSSQKNSSDLYVKEERHEKRLAKRFKEKFFKQEYVEFIKEKKRYKYYQDDINVEYKKNLINKNFENIISFQIGMKRIIEILIIILLLINALLKCNIISFILLLILIPTYNLNFINTHLMFRISFIVLFLLIIQYIIFTSNLSYITNPFINKEIVLNINQIFHIPWYNDYRWSTFYSLGTNRYQIISIWLDVIIILILYFYLEYFSFTIFREENKILDLKIISKKYYKKFSQLNAISKNEFRSFIRAMKVSYNIELIPSYTTQIDKNIDQYIYKAYNKYVLKLLFLFQGDKRLLKVQKNSKTRRLINVRNFIYISFQYLFLIITLLISSFNQGLIGFGYMTFSIFYIYKSHCFLKGRRWTLLYGIHYFMKPFLFFDILTQFIFQIPLDTYKKYESELEDFFKYFGYVKIADYFSQKEFISSVSCFIVFLKILCYFLLLLQENMYSTYEFHKFILKYHYEYLQKAYIKGKLHAFLFNNHRVKLMNERNKENRRVKLNLLNIEKTVNKWNIKITSYNKFDNFDKNNNIYNIPDNQSISSKKEKGITISKILRKHWLISLAIRIFEASNSVDDKHFNIAGYILKILKGNFLLYYDLDNLINEYEEKNYEKYNDITKVKKLLNKFLKQKNKNKTKYKSKDDQNISHNLIYSRRKSGNIIPIYNNNLVKYNLIDNKINGEINEEYNEKVKSKIGIKKLISLNNNSESENENEINSEKDNIINLKEKINSIHIDNNSMTQNENQNEKDNNKYIKLDQSYDDMFFAHSDYRDLKKLIRDDFFNTYCSRKKIFLILLKSIWKFLFENNEYIIYFFLLLNHVISGNMMSLFYPMMVLILGIIQYPRPSKLFWKILMVYTTLIIFLKFFIQLNIWEMIEEDFISYFDESNDNYISSLGLKKIANHDFLSFMGYIIPDFIVLLLLIINQIILIRKGLWYIMETDYESIEKANYRIIKFNSKEKNIGFDENNTHVLSSNEILKLIGKPMEEINYGIIAKLQRFHRKNFTKLRNEKPGKDFYTNYTIIQIIILIYIIFLYTKMERDSIIYNASVFKLKQFSGNMVIFAFIHVFILVIDRFIYLKNARKLKKISFKVFNKKNGTDITKKFENQKYDDVVEYIENKNKKENIYEVISFQFEDTQLGLLLKYILQIILVIFIHLFIYYYLPKQSKLYSKPKEDNNDDSLKENKVTTNGYIFVFYLLYIIYFLFSGLQIKYGLTDMRKVSSLMKASNLLYYAVYKIYIQIPFLFELKNFIDWTYTNTALDLWKWLKLEEVISLLFINKCLAKGNMQRRVGTITPNHTKFLMGGTTYFALIILIFGPLILFSSLNPTNIVNSVNSINLKIVLCMNINQRKNINLTLYETSNSIIQNFNSEEEYTDYLINLDNLELSNFNKSYKYTQVQKVKLMEFSEHKWDISYQLKNYISEHNFNNEENYYLSLMYSFTTKENKETSSNYRYEDKYDLSSDEIKNFLSKYSNTSKASLSLKEFYYPYLRIMEDNMPTPLVKNFKKNITLILEKTEYNTSDNKTKYNYNWYLKEEKQNNTSKDKEEEINYFDGIEFLTFTDLFSATIFGYDIITFYISFILVSGQVIRAIFLGEAERVIYTEMVNPNKLFSVCEGIKISRIRKNYLQEEKLYYLLIDMMRSPEIIKNVTQSSLIYLQEGNTVKKEIKTQEFEVESAPIIKKKINKRLI